MAPNQDVLSPGTQHVYSADHNLTVESKPAAGLPTRHSEDDPFSGRAFLFFVSIAVFAAFPRLILGLDTFFYRDFGAICYPQLFYLRQSLLGGELPFWDPYNYCGTPFLAQWGTWYPVHFLHLLFPVPWSVNFFHLLHLVFAGCGMYWLARRWGFTGYAAAFAAFAYVFNGVTLSCLMWPGYIAFLGWSPWVLGCTMEAWRHGGRWLVLAALSSAMQVLACAPELTVLFWALLGLLWVSAVARREVGVWLSLRRLLIIVSLAAGITMVQMLPFFDLLLHSQRDRNFGDDKWVMPVWGWANLLVPLFHCYRSIHGQWFQSGQELVGSYYLGAGVLILAITGAILRKRRDTAVLAGMALFCWAMAAGSHGLFFNSLKHLCPWIGVMRYPVKFALFPVILVPLLAAAVLDSREGESSKQRNRLLAAIGLLVLLIMGAILRSAAQNPFPDDQWGPTFRNAVWRAALAVALVAGLLCSANLKPGVFKTVLRPILLCLLPLDAFMHSPNIIPHLPVSNVAPGVWTANMKESAPTLGEGRIMSSPDVDRYLKFNGVRDMALDFTGRRMAERHSMNLLDSVPKATGGGMVLRPAAFDKLETFIYSTPNARYGSGLLDFMSVAWISSPDNPLTWTKRSSRLPLITAGQRPVFVPDDQALSAITADNFDPTQTVYLPESLQSLVTVRTNTRCTAATVRIAAQKIDVELKADERSLVVLSQSYYHLWRALLDGKPIPLLRANLAFQALQVPAGTHRLEVAYVDNFFRVGAAVSLLSIAACGLLWRTVRKRDLRTRPESVLAVTPSERNTLG